MRVLYFSAMMILSLFSCRKDEICNSESPNEIQSIILGSYDTFVHHHKTIDLGDAIALISSSEILILPYDTLEESFVLKDDFNFNGIEITEFDTIIHRRNSFYRFSFAERAFEHIYTPPYSIDDFCVTPGHGIGFFWSKLFEEPRKFNYYNFAQNQNETIFQYSEFLQDSVGPYWEYQTYIKNDTLKLLLRTANNSNFLANNGVFYSVDIDNKKLLHRVEYENSGIVEIIDYQDFSELYLLYSRNEIYNVATFNWLDNAFRTSYRFPSSFLKSSFFIEDGYLSLVLHALSNEQKVKLIEYQNQKEIFNVDTPSDYQTSFAEVRHFQDEYLMLFERQSNEALIYDMKGCIISKLVANKIIDDVMYTDESKVVVRNESNEIELFWLL